MLDNQSEDIDKITDKKTLLSLKAKCDKHIVSENFNWETTQKENKMLEQIDKRMSELGYSYEL